MGPMGFRSISRVTFSVSTGALSSVGMRPNIITGLDSYLEGIFFFDKNFWKIKNRKVNSEHGCRLT